MAPRDQREFSAQGERLTDWRRLRLATALAVAASGAAAQPAMLAKLEPAEGKIERLFSGIGGVRELADGRILVSDVIERTVFVVDFTSGMVSAAAPTGQGPGEYENPGGLFPIGADSTLLIERPAMRWHVFYRSSLVRSFAPTDRVGLALRRLVDGADTVGNVIHVLTTFDGTRDPAVPSSSQLIRGNRWTGRVDTVTTLTNSQSEIIAEKGSDGRLTRVRVRRVPFSVGDEVALFEDGWLAIVRTDPYRVDWINPAGEVLRGRPLAWPRTRITIEDVMAFMLVEGGRNRTAGTTRAQATYWMGKVPASVPAVLRGGLVAMGSGNLLIRHPPTASSSAANYHMVNRRGRLIGSLTLSAGQEIVAISAKWAYVITTRGDGLQLLSRHRWATAE